MSDKADLEQEKLSGTEDGLHNNEGTYTPRRQNNPKHICN